MALKNEEKLEKQTSNSKDQKLVKKSLGEITENTLKECLKCMKVSSSLYSVICSSGIFLLQIVCTYLTLQKSLYIPISPSEKYES